MNDDIKLKIFLIIIFAFFICYMLQYDIEGFGWSDFKKGLKSGASLAEHATGIDKAEKLAKETEKYAKEKKKEAEKYEEKKEKEAVDAIKQSSAYKYAQEKKKEAEKYAEKKKKKRSML